MTTSRAVFIEFPEQIPVFESALGGLAGACVVALTPHASLELEWRGIAHFILPDYFDEKKIEEFGAVTTANVNRLVALIDGLMHAHVGPFKTVDFRPAWMSAYNIKKLYDSVALRLYELSHFFDAVSPVEIVYATPVALGFDETLNWNELSVYSHVLRVAARETGIAGREIEFDYASVTSTLASTYLRAESATPPSEAAAGASWAPRYARIPRIAAGRIWNAAATAWRRAIAYAGRNGLHGALPVVVDLQRTLPADVWQDRAVVWFWDRAEGLPVLADGTPAPPPRARDARPGELRAVLATAFDAMRRDPEYAAIFQYRGWNWGDIVAPRMQRVCTETPLRLWEKRGEARNLLTAVRADVVLFNNPNSLSIKVVADTARQLGIAVVGLQHGEYGFRENSSLQYQDYAFCDELLVTGDAVRDFSARHYPGAVRTTTVGWPHMDSWRSRQMTRADLCTLFGFDPERRVVIVCLTALDGNARALRNAVASDCTTTRILRKVVDVCLRHTDIQFLIKAHPSAKTPVSPFYAYLERAGASHVKINSTVPFAGMVGAGDMFIVNCPSTTLIQLALYDQPIYVLENWFRWEPAAREAAGARCALDDDVDRFCARLEIDLASGAAFQHRATSTLLRNRYADHFGDGQSAGRARDAIVAAAWRARSARSAIARPTPREDRVADAVLPASQAP